MKQYITHDRKIEKKNGEATCFSHWKEKQVIKPCAFHIGKKEKQHIKQGVSDIGKKKKTCTICISHSRGKTTPEAL